VEKVVTLEVGLAALYEAVDPRGYAEA